MIIIYLFAYMFGESAKTAFGGNSSKVFKRLFGHGRISNDFC